MTTVELPPVTYTRTAEDGSFETATLSLTGYEKRIAEFAVEHTDELAAAGVSWGSSKIKRLAYRLCKEQARVWDEDLWNVFGIPDPTPAQAFRNLEDEGALR